MSDLHALGAFVTLAALTILALGSAVSAWRDRWHRPAEMLRWAVLGLIALQVVVGGVTWLSGARPHDPLHLLYGIALLVVLPLAETFAEDVPPDLRRGVVAAAAVVGLLLVWRLFVTG